MCFTYLVCPKERGVSRILCQLLKVERCYRERYLSNPSDGRMPQLTWRSSSILDSRFQFRLLADKKREPDRDKTMVTSHRVLCRFILMLFGLKTAPSTFECAMDVILLTDKWKFGLVYLDDSVILNSMSDHLSHLGSVLGLLSNTGVSLKLKNCKEMLLF